MEEIMQELRKIRRDLDDQKIAIEKSGEKVTEKVTQNINNILEDKFKLYNEKYEQLKEKCENQEKRLYFLEKQARKNNIVFFGIKDMETSYSNLENLIVDFIKEHFSQELDRRDIQEVRRVGKKGEKPRPIIVTFGSLGIKINLFKNKNVLNNTGYYIMEDFPQNILEKRKELQEQAKIEREKGNLVKIKYDKLVISEKIKTTGNNKRMLSISPENKTPIGSETNTHSNKKNKSQAHTKTQIRRTSSISEGVLKPGMLNYLINKNTNNSSDLQQNNNVNQ